MSTKFYLHLSELATIYLVSLVCLVERYQLTVSLKPSSSGVLALKPNSFSALEVLSIRLGWPSGLLLSQIISPLKPVWRAIKSNNIRLGISIEPFHGFHLNKVIILTSWYKDIFTSPFLELLHHKGAKETSAAGDQNAFLSRGA